MNCVEEALQKLKEITENYDEDLNRFFRCYMRVLHWTGVCVENEGIKRGIEKDLAIMREMYIKEHKGDEKYAGWIKTSERLPEQKTRVIISNGKSCDIGQLHEDWLDNTLRRFWSVEGAENLGEDLMTYWMPLPEPPEVKE